MKGYLVLQNGKVYEGERFGSMRDSIGELVFSTAMVGYCETLTDPSYYGQIIMQTFPLVGNYGVCQEDFESSKIYAFGYIVRQLCEYPSNFRSEGGLEDMLIKYDIPALQGIDTRAVTRQVREAGVMNAAIVSDISDIDKIMSMLSAYTVKRAVKSVSSTKKEHLCDKNAPTVVLWDFGAKGNIVRHLLSRGLNVISVPYNYTAERILELAPDGIMLSNGPGDPKENTGVIKELASLVGQGVPIFGICLGHQLLALAHGATTQKLKYGHRGINQPVKFTSSGRVYVTSQNHGYAVVSDSLPKGAELMCVSMNDGTCEGAMYDDGSYSVQFHPEAGAGPHDTQFLFNEFADKVVRYHAGKH
ncbi:MAG: carbamoyl phosphate synthase small subunit [Clostridia bacterium]|nr:carbamoyl phosphate synthase small subunit [Clostridia bacterium]